jgi:hypothetical protein
LLVEKWQQEGEKLCVIDREMREGGIEVMQVGWSKQPRIRKARSKKKAGKEVAARRAHV